MKQTTEQELKEKLALFAGFIKWPTICRWPDFPHDIKACIEYLEPQLDYVELTLSKKDNVARVEVGIKGDFFEYDGAYEEGLALAFCRAVEKAIDKGMK